MNKSNSKNNSAKHLHNVEKKEKKLENKEKHLEQRVKHLSDTRKFKRNKDPELRRALMSAYFPEEANSLVFPKPVGNYDSTGYQGMDKTIHNMGFVAGASDFVGGRVSSITNIPVFQGFASTDTFSYSTPFGYDRQFPDISQTHQCRLVGCTATFEMIKGNLANTTGNLVIALIPEADSWGEVTGPVFNSEDLAIMHGAVTITAAELAAQPVTVTFARVGALCDSFKSSAPMLLALSKDQKSRIKNGKGFTHNAYRVDVTPAAPGALGDQYHATKDVLMPAWHANFSTGTDLRITVERHWDLTLVPQDTSVMSGVNATRPMSDKNAERLAKITHSLPIVPAPTPAMPAQAIIDRIANTVEAGAEWVNRNQDNIETAGRVFGTTVKIGAKLAGALL